MSLSAWSWLNFDSCAPFSIGYSIVARRTPSSRIVKCALKRPSTETIEWHTSQETPVMAPALNPRVCCRKAPVSGSRKTRVSPPAAPSGEWHFVQNWSSFPAVSAWPSRTMA